MIFYYSDDTTMNNLYYQEAEFAKCAEHLFVQMCHAYLFQRK